mgnify:CR=1 FL=1
MIFGYIVGSRYAYWIMGHIHVYWGTILSFIYWVAFLPKQSSRSNLMELSLHVTYIVIGGLL